MYTEGRAHLSHERPPVFDTRSVAHACRSNLAFVLTISGHWCALSPEPSPYTRTLCTHADCCMCVLVQAAAAANTIVAAAILPSSPPSRRRHRRSATTITVLWALPLSQPPPTTFSPVITADPTAAARTQAALPSPLSPPLLPLTVATIAGTVVASTITPLSCTNQT